MYYADDHANMQEVRMYRCGILRTGGIRCNAKIWVLKHPLQPQSPVHGAIMLKVKTPNVTDEGKNAPVSLNRPYPPSKWLLYWLNERDKLYAPLRDALRTTIADW